MNTSKISALFCDLGGVLLTNGWDRSARHRAALQFDLKGNDFDERHQLYFPLYEQGLLSLDQYLDGSIFYQRRSFTRSEFIDFIYAQSHLDTAMQAILRRLKLCRPLKFVAISNEGAELARYRAQKFQLLKLFDVYVVSGFVHLRKPDPAIYRLALELVQLSPEEVLYIDDRKALVDAGAHIGLHAYHHQSAIETALFLEQYLGLVKDTLKLPSV